MNSKDLRARMKKYLSRSTKVSDVLDDKRTMDISSYGYAIDRMAFRPDVKK